MATLTKDQIAKLTPEQQETLDSIEAQRVLRRLRLIEQARGYRGFHLVPLLMGVVAVVLYGFGGFDSVIMRQFSPYFIVVLLCLIEFHAYGTNRRLDALMELTDHHVK